MKFPEFFKFMVSVQDKIVLKILYILIIFIYFLFDPFRVLANNDFIKNIAIFYSAKISEDDLICLSKYDVVVLNRFNFNMIDNDTFGAIKKLKNECDIYVYQLGAETNIDQDEYLTKYLNSIARYENGRGHSMGSLKNDNPSLILTGRDGRYFYNIQYPNSILMDFGSKDYQKYWIEATFTDILLQPWRADGVLIDNCLVAESVTGRNPFGAEFPVSYGDAQRWNDGMNDFVGTISLALRQDGQKMITNRGNSRHQAGYDAWLALDQSGNPPDIVMEEGAFAVSWGANDVQFYPENDWKRQVDVVGKITRSEVALISHTKLSPENPVGRDNFGRPVTFWQALWYSMCSYHLARRDAPNNSYFMFKTKGYQSVWWFDGYDRIDLGRALGEYTVRNISGTNVYMREFEKGYVLVNPTRQDATSVSLPQSCIVLTHVDRQADASVLPVVSAIDLPSNHGVICVKAAIDQEALHETHDAAPTIHTIQPN
ncbi:MAG: putative glycoside hydrolase [Desulfobulbus sp.]